MMTELKWEGTALDIEPNQWYKIVVPTVRALLLDEASNPVVGQECLITGPNGFRRVAFTDARGRVSIPAPVGDDYEISYVNLDQDVWALGAEPTTKDAPASSAVATEGAASEDTADNAAPESSASAGEPTSHASAA